MLVALMLAGIAGAELGLRPVNPASSRALVPEPVVLAPALDLLRGAPSRHVRGRRAAAIVTGITFGRTDEIGMADRERFRRAGLWHVLR